MVRYAEDSRGGETEREYAYTVHRFFKATSAGCPPIRFAVGDLHRLRLMQEKHGQLWCRDASAQRAARKNYGVLLQDMKNKLVTCDGDADGEEWYLQYNNQSHC